MLYGNKGIHPYSHQNTEDFPLGRSHRSTTGGDSAGLSLHTLANWLAPVIVIGTVPPQQKTASWLVAASLIFWNRSCVSKGKAFSDELSLEPDVSEDMVATQRRLLGTGLVVEKKVSNCAGGKRWLAEMCNLFCRDKEALLTQTWCWKAKRVHNAMNLCMFATQRNTVHGYCINLG